MTPQQIEYVLLVAQLRSFSKAAQKLYISQPSLSKYIINIERQLGRSRLPRMTWRTGSQICRTSGQAH